MNIYPVITLYQPWATWIMRGWKTIETRTHARFVSLLNKEFLIHAGQKTDNSDYAIKNPYLTKEQILHDPDEMCNGFILGKVFCYDFMHLSEMDAKDALIECETDRYGLFLEKVNKFEKPLYCKGEMGIWYYDFDNKCKVKKPATETLTLFADN